MKNLPKNVGRKDSAIRFFLAAIVLATSYYLKPSAPINWILYGVAVVLALTAQFHFCPLYFLTRIKTNTKD
jgi:fucose 4-O-acetylase-like acetyltransferase